MQNPILDNDHIRGDKPVEDDEDDVFFGKSMFKGKTGWRIESY
jgi:hypothetical protein